MWEELLLGHSSISDGKFRSGFDKQNIRQVFTCAAGELCWEEECKWTPLPISVFLCEAAAILLLPTLKK